MEYGMNKGVGRSVEFRGLTSQYLFLFDRMQSCSTASSGK